MWGKLQIINLYECDKDKITSKKEIKKFTKLLCEHIKMKRVGKTRIKRFGKGKLNGFSVIQFIETSSITIHFDEIKNRAFIDIFSCKNFNSEDAREFSKKFFDAKKISSKTVIRN